MGPLWVAVGVAVWTAVAFIMWLLCAAAARGDRELLREASERRVAGREGPRARVE